MVLVEQGGEGELVLSLPPPLQNISSGCFYAYDKNNAGHVNVGPFPQLIWSHCKLRKCVDEYLCSNVQSLVTKQLIFVSKQNSIEKQTSKIFEYSR